MVSHDTKHPLVIIGSVLREELNDNSSLRVGSNGSFKLREREYITLIRVELEGGWLGTLIDDV